MTESSHRCSDMLAKKYNYHKNIWKFTYWNLHHHTNWYLNLFLGGSSQLWWSKQANQRNSQNAANHRWRTYYQFSRPRPNPGPLYWYKICNVFHLCQSNFNDSKLSAFSQTGWLYDTGVPCVPMENDIHFLTNAVAIKTRVARVRTETCWKLR